MILIMKFPLLKLLLLCVSIVYGVKGSLRSVSKKEDLEFERQLKILNKTPIKTFQGEAGDIFDCVDIHKQPAFDHPLLKNHKIQMEPTSFPEGMIEETSALNKLSWIKPKGINCPQGTVPIKRTRKEDLIRAKSFSSIPSSFDNICNPSTSSGYYSQYRALAGTVCSVPNEFVLAQSVINVYNPKVEEEEATLVLIWLESGIGDQLNSIHVGWAVAPSLFGDSYTRLYTSFSVDPHNRTGCINLLCPGFIQVDQRYPLGEIITPVSRYDGPQYEIPIALIQDNIRGDWWLTSMDKAILYGYWPSELFPELSKGASVVAWGGLTKTPTNGLSPPMGSGYFPDDIPRHSVYIKNVAVAKPEWNRTPALISVIDSPKCYNLKSYAWAEGIGTKINIGGPGGNCTI